MSQKVVDAILEREKRLHPKPKAVPRPKPKPDATPGS